MINEQQIAALAQEKIQGSELFLVEVNVGQGNQIRVYLDGDNGVTIDDCKSVSKFIESQLDRETEDFSLEVSSAGLSRPLKLLRQYQKNLDRVLKIKTTEGQLVSGKLIQVSEQGVMLQQDQTCLEVSFEQVKEAKIEITFNK